MDSAGKIPSSAGLLAQSIECDFQFSRWISPVFDDDTDAVFIRVPEASPTFACHRVEDVFALRRPQFSQRILQLLCQTIGGLVREGQQTAAFGPVRLDPTGRVFFSEIQGA